MGGERFDVLIQKVSSGIKLLRTWTAKEIERLATWLKRMNARGYGIWIRPAGEHGLVLVDGLTAKDNERLQKSTMAPAAAIEIAPGKYQAWVKLSDRPVTEPVRKIAGTELATQFQGAIAQGDSNVYGHLAGFINQTEQRCPTGQQTIVQAHDCPGDVAPGGKAYVALIDQAIDNVKTAQEKHQRLQTIKAFEPDNHIGGPVNEYRRLAKQLLEKHGNVIDLTKMDLSIATQMLRFNAFAKEGVEHALKTTSPSTVDTRGDAQQNYIKRTMQLALSRVEEEKQMRQKARELKRAHERTRGRGMGR